MGFPFELADLIYHDIGQGRQPQHSVRVNSYLKLECALLPSGNDFIDCVSGKSYHGLAVIGPNGVRFTYGANLPLSGFQFGNVFTYIAVFGGVTQGGAGTVLAGGSSAGFPQIQVSSTKTDFNSAGNVNYLSVTVDNTLEHCVVITCTSSMQKIWIDGILRATRSGSASFSTGGTAQLFLANGEWLSTGGISLIAAAPYTMPDSLAGEISSSPYKTIFKPSDIGYFVPETTGGSSTNLVTTDTYHLHSADPLVLTLDSSLFIDNSFHAISSPNLVLSTDWLLTISNAIHTLTSDNLILGITGETSLIISPSFHALLSDNITLSNTDLTTLITQNATHTFTSDNVILSVTEFITLVVQNALHSTSSDNVILDTSNATILSPQDSFHAVTNNSIAFDLDTYLTISNAIHAHLADSPILITDLSLNILNTIHDVNSSILVLSLPGTGTCPTVEEIVAAIMIQMDLRNYLTVPKFLALK